MIMETLKSNSEKNLQKRILKSGAFFLLCMLLFTVQAMADAAQAVETISVEEAQANAARHELWNYIAMGVGLAVILFISIYTSFRKKKNGNEGTEPKPISHQPFKHRHDHHHGRRGSQMRRR